MNQQTVRVGLISAGRMGSFHAENLAYRVPGATLEEADRAIAAAKQAGVVFTDGL